MFHTGFFEYVQGSKNFQDYMGILKSSLLSQKALSQSQVMGPPKRIMIQNAGKSTKNG